jgi:DNA-binding transcriptional MerR regulator
LETLTIEQLAGETGMTVRNIRAHQSRGLLPPPEVHGRVGYYGPEHVARLKLIAEMQADGFNLRAIERLLSASPDAAESALGFKRALTAPFQSEDPEVVTTDELTERFPGDDTGEVLGKAERLGVLRPLGEGRYEVPSPTLLRAAEEVTARGVPLRAVVALVEKLKRNSEAVSRAFVQMFLEEVWQLFEGAGMPEERWPEIVETIERLRPLASEALLAVFHQAMTREVEDAFGKHLEGRAAEG